LPKSREKRRLRWWSPQGGLPPRYEAGARLCERVTYPRGRLF